MEGQRVVSETRVGRIGEPDVYFSERWDGQFENEIETQLSQCLSTAENVVTFC